MSWRFYSDKLSLLFLLFKAERERERGKGKKLDCKCEKEGEKREREKIGKPRVASQSECAGIPTELLHLIHRGNDQYYDNSSLPLYQ